MSHPVKVAIVHDWLLLGGAELVVEQLHKLYPDAPIYTSYCTEEWRQRLDDKVVTGWLQHLGKVRKFIPFLRIWWFTSLNLEEYDLVISSSGAEAKGVKTGPNTLHVNYCHAPTHYYWSRYDEYMEHPGFGKLDFLARFGLKLLIAPLRRWDLKASKRPDFMIANSTHIQAEIKKYYGRDSVVISPPVNTERFSKPENANLPRAGFLISGRQTPYKRFDLAVQACSELNLPLQVIGDGPDHGRLVSLAGPSVTFLGRVPDEELEKEFASASALIFPGLDDFGITPVEALASGTPVIAYQGGGALDYIVPGKTGEFFPDRTVESLKAALVIFRPESYVATDLRAKAAEFDPAIFREKIQKVIDEQLAAKSSLPN
jgi:glycosyltransferase involved in cell wall biosynthesis